MKKQIKYFWILFVVSLAIFLGSWTIIRQTPEPNDEVLVFVTMTWDQNQVFSNSANYELERAIEHFSDVVLGWTLDPSFLTELEVHGTRQEKQNLLFRVSSDSEDLTEVHGQLFLTHLEERLDTYNKSSGAAYSIGFSSSTVLEVERSIVRMLFGVWLFGLLFASGILFLWDYAYANRN